MVSSKCQPNRNVKFCVQGHGSETIRQANRHTQDQLIGLSLENNIQIPFPWCSVQSILPDRGFQFLSISSIGLEFFGVYIVYPEMSLQDQLTREAVRDLLKEINKKMFTQKKDAISKFISYIKSSQPKMTASTIELLLVGERKLPGMIFATGVLNWKGGFHNYTVLLLDLLELLLSSEYDYNKTVRKVLLELCLNNHSKKKSGNRRAAKFILQFLEENGRKVEDKMRLKPSKGAPEEKAHRTSTPSLSRSFSGSQLSRTSSQTRNTHSRSESSLPPMAAQIHASGECVTSDAKKKSGFINFLSGFFGRRPNQSMLEEKGILKAAKVFGARLDDVVKAHGKSGLPKVVVDCVEELRAKHLRHEGLFRIPGNNTNIIALKQKYDYGDNPNLADETANDVSGLLKLYLRDMPEPLFPWNKYDELLGAYDNLGQDKGESLRKVAATCPPNRNLLRNYLFEYCHTLSLNSGVNKMKPRNIAICLAPNVLRPKVEVQM
eukprot:jgi/Bigna1/142160/aug1.67_g16868